MEKSEECSDSLYTMAVNHVKKCILAVYNMSQSQGWFVLFLMLCYKTWQNPWRTFIESKQELQAEIELY